MTLKDFIKKQQTELDKFELSWVTNSKREPAQFPLELGEGDWLEQFELFQGFEKRRTL